MPYKISKTKEGKYKVTSPHGVKASGTSLKNAIKQKRLLQAIKHGFKPTGR